MSNGDAQFQLGVRSYHNWLAPFASEGSPHKEVFQESYIKIWGNFNRNFLKFSFKFKINFSILQFHQKYVSKWDF